ncbi:hypothetical protein J0383_07915 [Flavobacterium endoglycinae]|uniref:Glyoxalase n=1 Tax=Flavobacterium endoglycinae TaxID=2816357 RepID=A0ABX7QHZ3_9FLAO|nr:hypothetical protein [Flavobacterium endoglycinae]QSW90725.1 hypothetical protein J0383_07915 [Flavobacterium endoglycinae]
MKIEFEINNYQLSFINEMIADNLLEPSKATSKENRSFIYLMIEIANKLLKKAIDKRGVKKVFKLSLKYYEAVAVHQFLLLYIDYEQTEKRRVTREIIGIINQKLV